MGRGGEDAYDVRNDRKPPKNPLCVGIGQPGLKKVVQRHTRAKEGQVIITKSDVVGVLRHGVRLNELRESGRPFVAFATTPDCFSLGRLDDELSQMVGLGPIVICCEKKTFST